MESDSGGDPEDLDGGDARRLADAGNCEGDTCVTVNRFVGAPDPVGDRSCGDNDLTRNSTRARRRRPPLVRDLRRAVNQVSATQVRRSSISVEEDGAEDEDGEWHFVGDCGRQPMPDPAADLRPIGSKSKFWSLVEDEDLEVAPQSPLTPDLIRQAAVHGFSREQLCEAEMALQDSLVHRRVEASASPASTDKKAVLARNIVKAWIGDRRTAMTSWSGKLPHPRISPLITLGDCAVR